MAQPSQNHKNLRTRRPQARPIAAEAQQVREKNQKSLPWPLEGFVRLNRIIGPGNPVPVSKATWFRGVASGRFPQPVKLGPRSTAWRVEDLNKLLEELSGSTSVASAGSR